MSPSSPKAADTPAFKPEIPNASAAECHSKPTLSEVSAKFSPVGAEFEVVPVRPCSPDAPGTDAM